MENYSVFELAGYTKYESEKLIEACHERGIDYNQIRWEEMNMIIGNIIEFGYGDVAVRGSSLLERITFTNIKPPLECGSKITSDMDIEFGESVTINGDGTLDLYKLIKTVNERNTVVEYKGYTLVFSNYNEKSIEMVLKHSRNMVNWMILAC